MLSHQWFCHLCLCYTLCLLCWFHNYFSSGAVIFIYYSDVIEFNLYDNAFDTFPLFPISFQIYVKLSLQDIFFQGLDLNLFMHTYIMNICWYSHHYSFHKVILNDINIRAEGVLACISTIFKDLANYFRHLLICDSYAF